MLSTTTRLLCAPESGDGDEPEGLLLSHGPTHRGERAELGLSYEVGRHR